MRAKRKALEAIGVANQGKTKTGIRANPVNKVECKVVGLPLSMTRCQRTPRGMVIRAGRAFA
jgi:hypothetical protein